MATERIDALVGALAHTGSGLWRTQRSAVRSAVLCRALIWPDADERVREAVRVQLVNLSTGGMGLLAGVRFDTCARLVFETTVERIGFIQWRGRVRWCERMRDGIFRIGVQFVDVDGATS